MVGGEGAPYPEGPILRRICAAVTDVGTQFGLSSCINNLTSQAASTWQAGSKVAVSILACLWTLHTCS